MDKQAIRDLAVTVFSDALASELEQLSSDSSILKILDSEELRKLHSRYFIQCDLTESMPQLLEDLEIEIDPDLPIELVNQIIASIDQQWSGKYSMAQLYEHSKQAAHREILHQFGHGVWASEDPNIKDLFEELGIEQPECKNFESPCVYELGLQIQCKWLVMQQKDVLDEGHLVTLALDEDGDLVIIPTAQALMERDVYLEKPEFEAIWELLEDHLCAEWRNFSPEDVGGLSDCPMILSNDWEEDECRNPTSFKTLWWHSNYMVNNSVKEILKTGILYLYKAES